MTGNSQNYNVSYPSSQDTKPCMAIIIKYSFYTSIVLAVHNIHIMCCKTISSWTPYLFYNYFHSQFLITKLVRFEALFQHTFFRVVNYDTTITFVFHGMKTEGNYYPAPRPFCPLFGPSGSPGWFFQAPHQHLVLQGVFVSRVSNNKTRYPSQGTGRRIPGNRSQQRHETTSGTAGDHTRPRYSG